MIKYIVILILIIVALITIYAFNKSKTHQEMLPSLYDYKFSINDLNGNPIDFSQFKGKKLFLVNVASECGFTPQYKELQQLHETYGDKVTVIGLPCNQFGNQEPGTPQQIEEFCSLNYGVTFLMSEKIDVKGENIHPLYKWLTDKELNGYKSSTVKWNFQKYLLDENGKMIDFYYSITKPMSDNITKNLQ